MSVQAAAVIAVGMMGAALAYKSPGVFAFVVVMVLLCEPKISVGSFRFGKPCCDCECDAAE